MSKLIRDFDIAESDINNVIELGKLANESGKIVGMKCAKWSLQVPKWLNVNLMNTY